MSGPKRIRRWLLILSPLIVWLLVGAYVVHDRQLTTEQAFCKKFSSLLEDATTGTDPAKGGLTPQETNELALLVARRIDETDLAADAPPSMRPLLEAVERELAQFDRSQSPTKVPDALVGAMAKVAEATVPVCREH